MFGAACVSRYGGMFETTKQPLIILILIMLGVVCLSHCCTDAYFSDWNGRNKVWLVRWRVSLRRQQLPQRLAGTCIEPPEVRFQQRLGLKVGCVTVILSPWKPTDYLDLSVMCFFKVHSHHVVSIPPGRITDTGSYRCLDPPYTYKNHRKMPENPGASYR